MPSASQFLDDTPQSAAAFLDEAPKPSFGQNMANNLSSGLDSASNLVSPSYYSNPSPTPAENKLRELYKQGKAGISDYVDAFMEGGSNSPVGQAFNAVGGTVLNPVTTAVGNYINPAIADATGATPNEVAAAEMLLPIGAKGLKAVAPEASAAIGNAIVSAPSKVAGIARKVAPDFVADESSGVAKPQLAPAMSRDQLSELSSKYSQDAANQGGVLAPNAVNTAIDNAAKSINAKTEKGQIFAGKDDIASQYIDRLQGFKDHPITLGEFSDFDKTLGEQIQNTYDPMTKAYSPTGRNLIKIRQSLNDAFDNAKPEDLVNPQAFDSYKTAQKLAATSFRQGDIERIFQNAELSENPQQAIKAGFTRIAKGPMQGFTSEEQAAIRNAATTGIGTGILKLAGGRLLSGFAGFAGGGLPGAALAEAGAYGLRQSAGKIQAAKGTKVSQMLSSRPIVQDALTPIDPQVSGMRGRVNAANNAPSIAEPQQLLPSPATITPPPSSYAPRQITYQPTITGNEMIIGRDGLPRPMTIDEANAASIQRGEAANTGLTPDVARAQRANQVGSAYDSNAAIKAATDQAQRQALEQAFAEHQIMGAQPNSAMMQALQKAFIARKLNAK